MLSYKNIKKYFIVAATFVCFHSVQLFSQNEEKSMNTFMESLADYVDLSSLYLNALVAEEDFGNNPYFLPVVFDGKFMDDMSLKLPVLVNNNVNIFFTPDTIYIQSEGKRFVDRLRRKAYRNLLRNHIELVKYKASDFPDNVERITEVKPDPLTKTFKTEYDPDYNNVDLPGIFKPKKIYWIRGGSNLVQFSQNYISENWYKGGVGNLNLISVHNYTANYKKDNIQFNNFIEWKLSFHTNPNDTLRSFKIGDDLLRYYGDFGIRAFQDHWSYSTNVEIKTQLFKNYKENSDEIISSFTSPLIINVGLLGMKYQLDKDFVKNKYKKLSLSTDISLLSAQYTHVSNKIIDETRFGIEEGKNHLLDLGSTINAKLVINFNREISYTSRFKLFTNYEKVIIESENELNLSLSRYFSTRLYFYPRFDDSPGIVKDAKLGYFQISEVLSFGFNFKW
jgi:hypothetical protein